MDYIKLTGNNGSVASPDFISFQLEIKKDGQSELSITKGRAKEVGVIAQEKKQVDTSKVTELLNKAKTLASGSDDFVMVGGPEKIIGIRHGTYRSTIKVTEENPESNKFFHKCLHLFNSDLEERLNKIIYF